jgi:hypothetical protein
MNTTAEAAFTPGCALSRIGLAGWAVRAAAGLRDIGPYAAIEILLPGGSLFALLLWLFRRHKVAEVVMRKWRLFRKSLNGLVERRRQALKSCSYVATWRSKLRLVCSTPLLHE